MAAMSRYGPPWRLAVRLSTGRSDAGRSLNKSDALCEGVRGVTVVAFRRVVS